MNTLLRFSLFLNSRDKFSGCLRFTNSDFPELPPTDDGLPMISLSIVPRYTEEQLKIYRASSLGFLKKDVAAKILAGIATNGSALSGSERDHIKAALKSYM